ncbi:MAG: tRNA (adenosine(37)-N6)-threonylcarbamoyltransferase complex dimerization subunit type 1 TsaB [Clostridia bacterium]|nr:tRNA (adenosine(37)-N6)-threonylcarbamoyltransferase complex dimerization subunit type 1 TsaB [Clostridia bacterium]
MALDSTATTASVALCEDTSLIAMTTLNAGLTHSEALLPLVEQLLIRARLTPSDIDLFAISEGPGSFTGVRIGAATVKGLAFGREKPCIGVSTLESLAHNLACCDGIICPVMNARRDQVYNALFRAKDGALTRLCPDRAIAVSELSGELEAYNETIYICGDGAPLCRHIPSHPVPDFLLWQNGYSVAQCALALYKDGVRTTDTELAPTYLRLPQAERERLEKLKNDNSKGE